MSGLLWPQTAPRFPLKLWALSHREDTLSTADCAFFCAQTNIHQPLNSSLNSCRLMWKTRQISTPLAYILSSSAFLITFWLQEELLNNFFKLLLCGTTFCVNSTSDRIGTMTKVLELSFSGIIILLWTWDNLRDSPCVFQLPSGTAWHLSSFATRGQKICILGVQFLLSTMLVPSIATVFLTSRIVWALQQTPSSSQEKGFTFATIPKRTSCWGLEVFNVLFASGTSCLISPNLLCWINENSGEKSECMILYLQINLKRSARALSSLANWCQCYPKCSR